MYTHQISIQVANLKNLPDAFNAFEFLLASYKNNGQILGNAIHAFIDDSRIVSVVQTHEENSLSALHKNYYTDLRIKGLEEVCGNTLQIALLGGLEGEQRVCTCAKSEFYLLITEHTAVASPIKCGTCFEVVPLYKLPPVFDHTYYPVLHWENNYHACDTLQTNGGVGEDWAIEQLSNPNSELSIQGRGLCAGIEQQTATPTFYYLHNAKETTVADELDSVCPACKTPWLLMKPLAGGVFPFQCNNCRLISSFSTNIMG